MARNRAEASGSCSSAARVPADSAGDRKTPTRMDSPRGRADGLLRRRSEWSGELVQTRWVPGSSLSIGASFLYSSLRGDPKCSNSVISSVLATTGIVAGLVLLVVWIQSSKRSKTLAREIRSRMTAPIQSPWSPSGTVPPTTKIGPGPVPPMGQ